MSTRGGRTVVNDAQLAAARAYATSVVSRILGFRHSGAVEDVLQEACVKAWAHYDRFRGDCSFNSWFYRIAVNQSLMFLRSQGGSVRVSEPLSDELRSSLPGPEERLVRLERRRELAARVRRLPPKLRGELLRFMMSDRGDPANRAGAAKARRHRALCMLRCK